MVNICEMTADEFVKKTFPEKEDLPKDCLYNRFQRTSQDILRADLISVIEGMMKSDAKQNRAAVRYAKKYAHNSVGDMAVGFHHGVDWLRSRIIEQFKGK